MTLFMRTAGWTMAALIWGWCLIMSLMLVTR